MRKFKFDKKYIPAFILAAACLVVAVLCIVKAVGDIKYHEDLSQSSVIDPTQIILIADGGNDKKIPKNTYLAIDDLMQKGFTYMKIDARLTSDKKWVSLAEEDISSVTNGHGKVSEYKYYELMNHNIKGAPAFTNPVIELVTDTVSYALSNSITPVVYVHNNSKSAIRTLIENISGVTSNAFYLATTDSTAIEYAKKTYPTILCMYYVDEITEEAIAFCRNTGSTLCFNAKNKNNTQEKLELMFLEEIAIACYGTETLAEVEELYKIGIRQFINDSIEIGAIQ